MPNRRNFLKHAALGATAAIFDDKWLPRIESTGGLGALAARKNMFFGTATAEERLINDAAYRAAVLNECNMLVPEYEMKWDRLRPTPTTYFWNDADYMVNFARQNRMMFRGHTLAWHRSLPSWFSGTVNRNNAAQFLTDHIRTVVGRYRGMMHSWDVVNEAIEPTDRQTNNLRNSPWFQLLGENYIDLAFRTAAQADPRAMLVYNEYGVEYDDNVRRDAVLALIRRLLSRGVPIHAVGIQGHVTYNALQKLRDNMQSFRTFLRTIGSLGLKIIITEFDCDDNGLPANAAQRDAGVAQVYGDYCSVVMNEPAVIGFITWGLSDKYTSLNGYAPRPDRQPQRPLPLDTAMVRKTPWYSLEFWLNGTAVRPVATSVKQTVAQSVPELLCAPNPASEHTTVSLTLIHPAFVQIRLFDIRGTQVLMPIEAALPAGEHRFSVNLQTLTSGMYTCVVSARLMNSQEVLTSTTPLTIVR